MKKDNTLHELVLVLGLLLIGFGAGLAYGSALCL